MLTRLLTSAALTILAACGSGSGLGRDTGFEPNDIEAPDFTPNTGGGSLSIASGGGVTFFNRIVSDGSVASNEFGAEIKPGAMLSTPPTSGSARMTGPFALRHATDLRQTTDGMRGDFRNDTGTITLDADFGAGTLRGRGVGTLQERDNELTVNGRVENGGLTGTATYGGTEATLTGFVGRSNAIGAFSTQTASRSSLAGGFIVAE